MSIFIKITKIYGKLKLKTKLMLNFLILTLLVSLVTAFSSYVIFSQKIETYTLQNFTQLLSQTILSVDNIFAAVHDTGKLLSYDQTLQNIFIKQNGYQYPLSEQLDDYKYLTSFANTSNVNANIQSIKLYLNNYVLYINEKRNLFSLADAQAESWFERTEFVRGAPVWSYKENAISCTRSMINLFTDENTIGFIELEVKWNKVMEPFNNLLNSTNGNVILFDDQKNTVVSLGQPDNEFEQTISDLVNDVRVDDGWVSINSKYSGRIMRKELLNGWIIYASVPSNVLRQDIRVLLSNVLIICFFSIILSTVLANAFSRQLAARLGRVANFMRNVKIDSTDTIEAQYHDEITIIETKFNDTLLTTREYIKRMEEANRKKKEADYNVLQEQIKPHFLYNCLDSINWMANECHAENIAKMSRLLGSFFRLSLSRGNQIIDLQDELKHVQIYLEIMQMRFDGNITFNIKTYPAAMGQKTLKLILQPIIENSILHGISGRLDQNGTILIVCEIENKYLKISITDDGIGMEPLQLEKLRASLSVDNPEGGYGLSNVNKRIKMYFGDAYGIHIDSQYGFGVTTQILLPKT